MAGGAKPVDSGGCRMNGVARMAFVEEDGCRFEVNQKRGKQGE